MSQHEQPQCRTKQAAPRRKNGTFAKGTSGNPGGKPAYVKEIRARLEAGSEKVTEVILEAARNGDMQACRLILERIVPAIKPSADTVHFALDGETSTDQARSIMTAIADGTIPPDQGKALIEALATVARIAELDELARRIAELEARL